MSLSLRGRQLFLTYMGILVLCGGLTTGSWSLSESNQSERLKEALRILSQVSQGQVLLSRTMSAWNTYDLTGILSKLKWDSVSRTDTVLTRHYDPSTGIETRDREVVIYLKENQSQLELVLDLVHELVHATARPAFDPYDPMLTAGKYVWLAIEGEGGEINAVTTECEVALALHKRFDWSSTRCQSYFDAKGRLLTTKLLLEEIKRDFYKVGKGYQEIRQRLGMETSLFPLLSPSAPRFFSSTGKAPYPISLFHEFEEINEIACRNSKARATKGEGHLLAKRCSHF